MEEVIEDPCGGIDLPGSTIAAPAQAPKPISRPKKKCLFGPLAKLKEANRLASLATRGEATAIEHSGATSHDRSPEGGASFSTHQEADRNRTPHDVPTIPLHQPGDRVTFIHPDLPPSRSPFDRYYHAVANRPRLNPNRFALRRMGLTEAALQENADREATELLRESFAERRLEQLFPPESIASPVPSILTREECMQLFVDTGVPTTSGALLGVYRWAAGLGEARYNFDLPPDVTDFSFMNAYDC